MVRILLKRHNQQISLELSRINWTITQEHFSSTVRTSKEIIVMTMHKSKGIEFDVGINRDRIIYTDSDDREKHLSLLALKVANTRDEQNVFV